MSMTGKLFIFNLKKFDNNSVTEFANKNHEELIQNNEKEIKTLISTFETFNCDIEIVEEVSKRNLVEKLTKIEKTDLSKYRYVSVAVLLHHQNENIGAEMFYFHNEIVLTFLKNFTLKQKPKLFLIQARKNNFDIFDSTPMTGNREYFTPTRMIVCYAARFNCSEYQDKQASRFIAVFCNNLQSIGLQNSIQRVMKNTIRTIEEETEQSQIPTYLDHFHGDLMLKDYLNDE